MQEPAAAQDVGTLMAILSTTHTGQNIDLSGRHLSAPVECSREGGALWAVPGWPQASSVNQCNVEKGVLPV